MRALRLAALAALALLASPAGSAATSGFAVSCGAVNAGGDVPCTVTRTSGGKGLYILFATSDGSAHAGTDYTAVKQLLYFKASAISQTVVVHTAVNPNAAGTLTFTASIAVGNVPSSTTGSIVEPAQPPASQWVSAPLQDGGFARVKANDSLWNMTGPGSGRPLIPGEIVAVYFNGWGSESDGSTSFAIYALSDGTSGRAKAADLEGVVSVGTPPGLPADWWVPGLVTANKTCTDARQGYEGQPGVTLGGTYRAAMLVGTHMKLAAGQTGVAASMWVITGVGDRAYLAHTVVTGDCLTGLAQTGALTVGSLVMHEGLIYRVASNGWPDPFILGGGMIYAAQYVSDTTGHYYLADDPVLKQEIQYFFGSDFQPVP